MGDDVQITAKLKLDTADAEAQLSQVGKDAAKELKGAFSGKGGLSKVTDIAKGATKGIGGVLDSMSAVSGVAGKLAGAFGLVSAVMAAIMKLLEGTDTLDAVKRSLNGLMNTLRMILAPFIAQVGDIVIGAVDILQDFLPLFSSIGQIAKLALMPVKLMLNALKALSDLLSPLVTFISNITNAIAAMMTILWGSVVDTSTSTTGLKADYKSRLDVWETAGGDVTAGDELISNTVMTGDKSAEDILKELLSTMGLDVDTTEAVVSAITTISGVLSAIKEPLSSLASIFTTAFSSALTTGMSVIADIFDILSPAFGWIEDFWKDVGTVLSALLQGVADLVSRVFSFYDLFKPGKRKSSSNVIGALSNTSSPAFTGFGGGGTGGRYADGGTIGGQVWAMNEKGNPEFVFNAGGHDTVINKEILSDALYSALMKAGVGKNKDIVLRISDTKADARQFARWILPALKLEWSR